MLVGAFLGDRAVVAIGVVSMMIFFIGQLTARAWPAAERCGWAACLAAVTLIWLLADRVAISESFGILRHAGVRLLAAAAIMTLMAALVTFVVRRRQPAPR